MNIKTAFLYGNVEETIYVTQLTGFKVGGKHKICRLKKALYGPETVPQSLIQHPDSISEEEPIAADYSVFSNSTTIIAIYVNDVLLVGLNKKENQGIKDKLHERFKMTDLGACSCYLGIIVTRGRVNRILRLGQAGYV